MTTWDLVGGAIRSAAVLGLALAAMPLLRRAQAATRRLVLSIALIGSAVVPFASHAVPEWRVLPAPELSLVQAPFAEPRGEEADAPAIAAGAKAEEGASSAGVGSHQKPSISWVSVILAIWGLGAAAVLGRLAIGHVLARGLVRRATPIRALAGGASGDGDVEIAREAIVAIERAERDAGAGAEVRLSAEVTGPMVTGVLSPVVLVPRSAVEWRAERWRAVLLHELSHVRSRDCLVAALGQVACAVSWPDPLVWVVARCLRRERERAADERALSTGMRPSEYASHLFAVAAGASVGRAAPLGALGMAERSELRARIEAIVSLRQAQTPASIAQSGAVAAGCVALIAVAACATPGTGEVAAPQSSGATAVTAAPQASAAARANASSPLAEDVAAALGVAKSQVELTIVAAQQAIVDEEMKRFDEAAHPVERTAIVLDPKTGHVVAIANATMAVTPRVSGSTMKPLVVAAALNDRAIAVQDRFTLEKGGRKYEDVTLTDATEYGELDITGILTVSSNIGASHIFDKLGATALVKHMRALHFGRPLGVELREGAFNPLPASLSDGSLAGASLAGGHLGKVASPLHMAAAYATLANQGMRVDPTFVKRVDGSVKGPRTSTEADRVFSAEASAAVIKMLESAVYDERATGKAARIDGVRVAGKTGTWEEAAPNAKPSHYVSFIGIAPASAPRFVVLVGAVVDSESATGGKVAAPVFARIMARALAN